MFTHTFKEIALYKITTILEILSETSETFIYVRCIQLRTVRRNVKVIMIVNFGCGMVQMQEQT